MVPGNSLENMQQTLAEMRLSYNPQLPVLLEKLSLLEGVHEPFPAVVPPMLKTLFPQTAAQPVLRFQKSKVDVKTVPLRVGVVLSGGQAPGGHNVITGLVDALLKIHPESRVIGFLDGPKGIMEGKSRPITKEEVAAYRNQGGFDLLGSGRDKIETPEQFEAAEAHVRQLGLDGLVVIGGDDSNTNAAWLAEFFLSKGNPCRVVGVPKTIDGDLKNEWVEASFGFDTAAKTYSEIIGNIARDALSAKKYYYFIKLMGRSASHITLECALQTHPNITLIGEEVQQAKKTMAMVVSEIADVICQRAEKGKNFGVILIPEGIIEFIPEFKQLIQELNTLLSSSQNIETLNGEERLRTIQEQLSPSSAACFSALPPDFAQQLLWDRDPHGNVQVSKIETERLFMQLVEKELKQRKKEGSYKGKFSAQPHFCGYEGRSALPSNFDCQYCYALGHLAALLVHLKATGYLCALKRLSEPSPYWIPMGIPLVPLMHVEERHGKAKPVIQKALVDLKGKAFYYFQKEREKWKWEDQYRYPGPLQFYGPSVLTDGPTLTIQLDFSSISFT